MQVLCLGSKCQLLKLDVKGDPRHCRLCSAYYQLRQLRVHYHDIKHVRYQMLLRCLHLVPPGLLQRTTCVASMAVCRVALTSKHGTHVRRVSGWKLLPNDTRSKFWVLGLFFVISTYSVAYHNLRTSLGLSIDDWYAILTTTMSSKIIEILIVTFVRCIFWAQISPKSVSAGIPPALFP